MKLRILAFFLITLAASSNAQRRIGHDPLNADEADKLRDTAQLPNKRLKLYVDFAKARLTKIDQLLADPKAKDRGSQIHDLLADFAVLEDEIGDNLETFHGQQYDIRKSLKLVIEGDEQFQLELRKLSQAADDPKHTDEAEKYKFALNDAIESLKNNADDARHTVQEQNALAKNQKLHKEEDMGTMPVKK